MQYYLKKIHICIPGIVGRNASNLKPLAPLEDTQPTFLHPFRSQAEDTENTSPTAVTAPGAPWGCGDSVLVPLSLPGAGATWNPAAALLGGAGLFLSRSTNTLLSWRWDWQWELFFHQAVWVLCFSLTRGVDQSLLSSSEFHTCTLLFGLGFVIFFSSFFNYKTFSLYLKAAAPVLETCSCKTFALVVFFGFLLFCWDFLWTERWQREKNIACVLHLTEVEILALLKGPGSHLVFLVLTDAVAHLPCAEISIFLLWLSWLTVSCRHNLVSQVGGEPFWVTSSQPSGLFSNRRV